MLFSIITITHNNLEGLRRTYESLHEQSLQHFEWLVIDGGSEDGTVEFLKSVSADFTSEPDHGIYDAMNKGIEKASGYFLLFLNAGDTLAGPDILESIAAYIHELQETPDFIYGNSLEQAPGREPDYKPARPYTKAAYGLFTHHQAMLYRRELIDGLRYDTQYKIAADYKFTLQFLQKAQTVVYCPFPICIYESGGASQQQAVLGRAEQKQIRAELKTVSSLQNTLIAMQQKIVWTFRAQFPTLYWHLKSKTNREKNDE